MKQIYIVGLGPGGEKGMTREAYEVLKECDVILGYSLYTELLRPLFPDKTFLSTPMRKERERCLLCFEKAMEGKNVCLVCSGDAGVYGLAGLMYEISPSYPEVELTVIPGVTAALSGAALLGAPLGHDFCVISLSDLLTPWETIEKRILAAAAGDFCIALYNPASHKRKDQLRLACDLLLQSKKKETPCGLVRNAGRSGQEVRLLTLEELRNTEVDMLTTVFIGNSQSFIQGGALITPRGYRHE